MSEETTSIKTRCMGEKTIVDIDTPNIDFRNAELIKSTVAELVEAGQRQLVINLSKISFMDSSGLGVILFCKRACDEAGGSLGLFGLQSYVNNLITLTNLNKAVAIYTSETEAVC